MIALGFVAGCLVLASGVIGSEIVALVRRNKGA